jgi:hypothetical protein
VDDPGAVDGGQGGGRSDAEFQGLLKRQWAVPGHLLKEGRALDELGHQVRGPRVCRRLDDARHGRVLDAVRAVGLFGESPPEVLVPGILGPDDLEGAVMTVAIRDQVDDPHRTFPEAAQHLIGPDGTRISGWVGLESACGWPRLGDICVSRMSGLYRALGLHRDLGLRRVLRLCVLSVFDIKRGRQHHRDPGRALVRVVTREDPGEEPHRLRHRADLSCRGLQVVPEPLRLTVT